MFVKKVLVVLLPLLFAKIVLVAPAFPEKFEGHYADPPRRHGVHGCYNTSDEHFLTLDFLNNIYTKIDVLCIGGDWHLRGERGELHTGHNEAIKIINEVGHGLETLGREHIEWSRVEAVNVGYFIFDTEHQTFDEFDDDDRFLVRW